MPVMDGLEFARQFRPVHSLVPILFISGRIAREAADAGLEPAVGAFADPAQPVPFALSLDKC